MLPGDVTTLLEDKWFAGLRPDRREGLLGAARVRMVDDGVRLYHHGDPPNGLHALVAGRVRLIGYPAPGVELVAKIMRPGQWFGEMSVLDGEARPHDAITAGPCRALYVPMAAISRLTDIDPALWRDLAVLSCGHQRAGLRDTGRIRTQPAIARLAGFLAGAAGQSTEGMVSLSQDDIAKVVGVSRQRLNTMLRELQRAGLVERRYRAVRISEPQALRRFVDSQLRAA